MLWLSTIVSNIALALLLAAFAWFVQRRLRLFALAHLLWVLVLVKLVMPPVWSVPLSDPPSNLACLYGTCGCPTHAHDPLRDGLPRAMLAAWSLGVVATVLAGGRRWIRFRRLLKQAVPAPAEWQAHTDHLAHELGVRRAPLILALPGRMPPFVVPGWRGPRMLVPVELLSQLSGSQQTVLLLHELVHIKRRDHWLRALEIVVSVAYWWLPPVRLIRRQLRACEEACCDAAVVARQPHARRDYARLLLDVLDFVVPTPRAPEPATAMSSANDLERRLRAILGTGPASARRSWPVALGAAVLACGLVPCELHYDWLVALAPEPAPAVVPATNLQGAKDASAVPIESIGSVSILCCPS